MNIRTLVVLATASSIALSAASAFAQDPSKGQATVNGESATFGSPLAILDPGGKHVSVVFTARPLPAAAEAASRKAGRWDVQGAGPAVVIDFDFAPTSTSGLVGDITSCRVAFTGFKTPLELKGKAADCLVLSNGGMLRDGGMMIGVVQGQSKAYSIRLPYSVSFGAAAAASMTPTAPASPAPAAAKAPAAPAATTIPANTASGTGTFTGQKITSSHGLAWWRAEDNEVRAALFDRVPAADMLAQLRKDEWGEGGPNVIVQLRLKRGAPLSIASVTNCYVSVEFPKGGPIGRGTDAAGCGIAELSGDARPGGTVAVRMKGQATGPGDKPYTWDLRFNLPIAK